MGKLESDLENFVRLCHLHEKVRNLEQALAEKDQEIARWKARSWEENVKFIAEAKENLLKEYIHLTELYGEQKHAIRKLTANRQQLMEKAVRFAENVTRNGRWQEHEWIEAGNFLQSPEVQAWKEQK